MILSRVCECSVCGIQEVSQQELLPKGWVILWYHHSTLCNECIIKWQDKWGETPIHWLKGGEEELMLL